MKKNNSYPVPEALSELLLFEMAINDLLPEGITVSMKRKNGRYIADFAEFHWQMWQKAREI